MSKVALITGISGQDGTYLAELLLKKGYEVHGLVNRPPSGVLFELTLKENPYSKQLTLHPCSFEDVYEIRRIIERTNASEIYHLAGQSSPRLSFVLPRATESSIATATMDLLEICREQKRKISFLLASSAEIFGSPAEYPQTERTPIEPVTPYGACKAYAQNMTKIYRDSFGLRACSAIMYNHESPRRGLQFVTQKIATAAAMIKLGKQDRLKLGNLSGLRDWGWAPDYVEALWLMLQQDKVDDYILATGELNSVEKFVELSFSYVDLNWQDYVDYDKSLVAVSERKNSCGSPLKIEETLGWKHTVGIEEIVARMVQSQLDELSR
jgi:GDPmannose 4,6-dehydratase